MSGVKNMNEAEGTEARLAAPTEIRENIIQPQRPGDRDGSCGCQTKSAATDAGKYAPDFIYALGRVVARFPSTGVEKEFARAAKATETTGLTDQEAFYAVLSKKENRYIARKILLGSDDRGHASLCAVSSPQRRPGDACGGHAASAKAS